MERDGPVLGSDDGATYPPPLALNSYFEDRFFRAAALLYTSLFIRNWLEPDDEEKNRIVNLLSILFNDANELQDFQRYRALMQKTNIQV